MFDPSALEVISAGDPALAREIASLYATDSASLLASFDAAVRAAQNDDVRRIAHTLKSSSATVGARDASALAARIENAGHASLDDCGALRTAVGAAVHAMEAALQIRLDNVLS